MHDAPRVAGFRTVERALLGLLALFAFALVFEDGLNAQATANRQTVKGDAKNGKRLYVIYGCFQCHGREAQGGRSGPRLAPRPMPLEGFIHYLRRPAGEMPPYTEKVVRDSEVGDIHAFLTTIPAPPELRSIPLLNP